MFHLSWQIYLTATFVFLGLYYIAISLLYFKRVVKRNKEGKIKPAIRSDTELPNENSSRNLFGFNTSKPVEVEEQNSAPAIQPLVDELQAYSVAAGKEKRTKEEIQISIRKIIQKYPGIVTSEFQKGITSLIAYNIENNCAIHLSAEELSDVWNQ
ncbi:hypothetical protein [Filimonas effusa]|uniref:Uncharacterized protein n=1 Tax=Filimonas effusa TaxID=2508721 RepID=A0A4Q1DBX9_9BACT|nr:hypothetical protein [Filimonas effusa]RXK86994.1 hypothetical protein ESB13_09485 [Filimonas effusa]